MSPPLTIGGLFVIIPKKIYKNSAIEDSIHLLPKLWKHTVCFELHFLYMLFHAKKKKWYLIFLFFLHNFLFLLESRWKFSHCYYYYFVGRHSPLKFQGKRLRKKNSRATGMASLPPYPTIPDIITYNQWHIRINNHSFWMSLSILIWDN